MTTENTQNHDKEPALFTPAWHAWHARIIDRADRAVVATPNLSQEELDQRDRMRGAETRSFRMRIEDFGTFTRGGV